MAKQPKGIKGMKRKLRTQKAMTNTSIKHAMQAASEAIDRLSQECQALHRILISERAQVIYYTEKYAAFVKRECVELVAKGFLDLTEAEQEGFIKRAVAELHGGAAIVPRDTDAAAAGEQAGQLGKKIITQ